MKRMIKTCCGFLLALSLAACGGYADQTRSSNTVSALSDEQIPFSSVSGSEPAGQFSTENHEQSSSVSNKIVESAEADPAESGMTHRFIRIATEEGGEIVLKLNESPAADSLYRQLPQSVRIEDFAASEKIFYPSAKLDASHTPLAQGPAGTLAYYEPWGNVALFYGECGGASGLYELGEAVSGTEFIKAMTGEALIEAIGAPSASEDFAESERSSSQQAASSSVDPPASQDSAGEISLEENAAMKINVQIENRNFTATLEENAAAQSLAELLKGAPLVIQMSDYSGFEKVGALGTSLPVRDSRITTRSGDIVLYNGNQVVIFYGTHSWSYTRLGKIDDLTGWEEALGNGDVTAVFSAG